MPQNVTDLIDEDEDDAELSESELIKKLRKQLKVRDKDNADLATVRRENAMLKAGVDTTSKLGALFARSFEGDLSDIEAIKAEAVELGIVQTPAATVEGGEQGGEGANDAANEGGQGSAGERSSLATGAMPDDGRGIDPRESAVKSASDRLNKGDTFEKAAGGLVSDLVQAAVAGDPRVIVPKGNAF